MDEQWEDAKAEAEEAKAKVDKEKRIEIISEGIAVEESLKELGLKMDGSPELEEAYEAIQAGKTRDGLDIAKEIIVARKAQQQKARDLELYVNNKLSHEEAVRRGLVK